MNPTDEQHLIAGILRKEPISVERFVLSHQDAVFAQSYRILGNKEDAQEAAQDALMKALKQMPIFEGRCKLNTWVYRITYNTCLDMLKKRRRKPKEDDIDGHQEASWSTLEAGLSILEEKEQRGLIETSITQLEETDALLIELYHLQEYPIAELSEITGMTEGAIKVRLFRARKKLALNLERVLPKETIEILRHGS